MTSYMVTVIVPVEYKGVLDFTNGPKFDKFEFQSEHTIGAFAEPLIRLGFGTRDGRWIPPAAILEIKEVRR